MANLSDDVAKERERDHVENHVRSLEQQTLDALLRIEELLQKPLVPLAAEPLTVTNTYPGAITKVTKPGKGKRGDYL